MLSLHLPLTEATARMLDANAVARLPAGAIIINTARGGLIDESALLGALGSGALAGAGLDVFDQEPLSGDHPFSDPAPGGADAAQRLAHPGNAEAKPDYGGG